MKSESNHADGERYLIVAEKNIQEEVWTYKLKVVPLGRGFPKDFTTTHMIFTCPACGKEHVLEGFEDFSDGMGEGHDCSCGTFLEVDCSQPTKIEREEERDEYDGIITKKTIITESTPKDRAYYLKAGKLGSHELTLVEGS